MYKETDMLCDDRWTVDEQADGTFELCDGDTFRTETPLLNRLDRFEERPVNWLWEQRIPAGMVTLIEGAGGAGKSFVSLAVAAVVSGGKGLEEGVSGARATPPGPPLLRGGATPEAGNVLILHDRDNVGHTVLPRLKKLGANLDKIGIYSEVFVDRDVNDKGNRRCVLPFDCQQLAAMVPRHDIRLIVIDALADFCKPRQMAETLRQLDRLAAKTGVAILVTSCNTARRDRRGRVTIRTPKSFESVRNAWCVIEDAEDPLLKHFVSTRTTFCEAPIGLAFRIKQGALTWEPLPPPPIDMHKQALQDAERWLCEELQFGRIAAGQVQAEARQCGISVKMLYEARLRLGVQTTREGYGAEGGWWWQFEGVEPANETATVERAEVEQRVVVDLAPVAAGLPRGAATSKKHLHPVSREVGCASNVACDSAGASTTRVGRGEETASELAACELVQV